MRLLDGFFNKLCLTHLDLHDQFKSCDNIQQGALSSDIYFCEICL